MFRISGATASILLLSTSSLVVALGCHIVAGIEEKEVASGSGGTGSGSSSSASTGGGGAGLGGAGGGTSSGGFPPLLCGMGAPTPMACMGAVQLECNLMSPPTNHPCHCGACRRDCGDDGSCSMGLCDAKLLAERKDELIYQASSNGNAVFFASFRENGMSDAFQQSTIYRADYNPLNAMSPVSISTNPIVGRVKVVAADCERVFFAIEHDSIMAGGQTLPGRVGFVSILNGTSTLIPLRSGQTEEFSVENMIADGIYVFWTSADGLNVWRKEVVVNNAPSQIKLKADTNDAVALALSPPYVYWSEVDFTAQPSPKGYIRRAKMGAGSPGGWPVDEIAEFEGTPRGIAVDALHVYFSDSGPAVVDTIKRVPRDPISMMPATMPEIVVPNADQTQTMGYSVGVDGEFVYYITAIDNEGKTHRVRKTGGGDTILNGDNGFREQWLTIDNKRVYMVSPSNGQIWWVAR